VYSTVRQTMGLADESRLARLIEVVTPGAPTTDDERPCPTAIFDFSPVAEGLQGYVWHFPCLEAGAPAMNRGIFDSRVHPEGERADLRVIFARALEALQLDAAKASWRSHPVRRFSPDGTFARPHMLLVGDA